MKQLITILLTIISLTSYSQAKYPITVSGSSGTDTSTVNWWIVN